MALTFSVYDGTNKQTVAYPVNVTGGDVVDSNLLLSLKDNTAKFISEESIRNAILSLNSSFAFKETASTQSTTASYIGLDSLNNSYRDVYTVTTGASSSWVKPKFYFGKRSYSGTYSFTASQTYHIMGLTHLSSDTDIFFFNTKDDLVDNSRTRLRLLSGTAFSQFTNFPYFQSQIIETGIVDSLSLDFVNPLGPVNLESVQGTVSINGIGIPEISNLSSTPTNNKVLLYDGNGFLNWGDITYQQQNYIGITGSELDMLGDPLTINGYTLEFTDSRWIPISVNDVSSGSTFSEFPISELLERMIYPYLPPSCSIEILPPFASGVAEVGSFPDPVIQFTINKKTLDTNNASLVNMIPGSYPSITSTVYETVTDSSSGIVLSPISATSTDFTISVGDGSQTASATTNLKGIYPYFYGFSNLTNMTNIGLGSLSKLVEDKSDKLIDLSGSGNYYFIYDFDYGTLSNIIGFGTPSIASFSSVTSQIFSSPTGLWAGKKFYVYQWPSAGTIGPLSVNFEFKY
jgi:hypothetical protein